MKCNKSAISRNASFQFPPDLVKEKLQSFSFRDKSPMPQMYFSGFV